MMNKIILHTKSRIVVSRLCVLSQVLEPFVIPIFWAVLTGFIIHPYKTWMADTLRQLLVSFRTKSSETPAFLLCAATLIGTLDTFLDGIGSEVLAR